MKGDSGVREHLRKVVETLIDVSEKKEEEEKKKEGEEEKKSEEGEVEKVEEEEEEGEKEEKKKPVALWCSFYTQTICSVPEGMKDIAGVSVLPEPNELIDYKNVLDASKDEFKRICTNDEEYLPKMPNPDDIIWTTEEENKNDEENKDNKSEGENKENKEETKTDENKNEGEN